MCIYLQKHAQEMDPSQAFSLKLDLNVIYHKMSLLKFPELKILSCGLTSWKWILHQSKRANSLWEKKVMLKRPTNVLVIIVVLWNYNQFKKYFLNTLYKTDTINNGEYS